MILLTKKLETLIDDCDFDLVSQFKWCASKGKNGNYYAATKFPGAKSLTLLHRLIMDCPAGSVVDHINGDGLDNRRENLRICSMAQNNVNRVSNRNTSGFRGVYFLNKPGLKKPWYARAGSRKGKMIHGGYFATPAEAARRYDDLARELFGQFAKTNFNYQQKEK
ncbi:MAG TPA: HNH endonuclease [Verrucomicrobiae bacterium]|nr:HNH endonuclease [Verrucomicrobiae bacterium]